MSAASQTQLAPAVLVRDFFKRSAGRWKSQRRYYTLKEDDAREVVSDLTVEFIGAGDDRLQDLAAAHGLSENLDCGSRVTWESHYIQPERKKPAVGSTIFGVFGDLLYRDRGFATPKPVTARYYFINPDTLCLRTEYNGSVFQEEIKLIGTQYRTRQTIISRAGEEEVIGQYLEKRV